MHLHEHAQVPPIGITPPTTSAETPAPAEKKPAVPFSIFAAPIFAAAFVAGRRSALGAPVVPSRAPEVAAAVLHGVYRIGVAAGAFALAYALRSVWPLFAAVPLLFLSPKPKK